MKTNQGTPQKADRRPSNVALRVGLVALPLSMCAALIGAHGAQDRPSNVWMTWSGTQRQAYVSGYVDGYYKGHYQGCQHAAHVTPTVPAADLVSNCSDRKANYSEGEDYFEKQITSFYQRYPENRNLSQEYILDALGKGLSIEEVHQNPPYPLGGGPLQVKKSQR